MNSSKMKAFTNWDWNNTGIYTHTSFPLKKSIHEPVSLLTLSSRAVKSRSRPSCFLCNAFTLLRSRPKSSELALAPFSVIHANVSAVSLQQTIQETKRWSFHTRGSMCICSNRCKNISDILHSHCVMVLDKRRPEKQKWVLTSTGETSFNFWDYKLSHSLLSSPSWSGSYSRRFQKSYWRNQEIQESWSFFQEEGTSCKLLLVSDRVCHGLSFSSWQCPELTC